MNWRNFKQAWYTADLILNGFLRQENVEVTWWDPQRHSNIVRKYSYKGELTKVGTEWPSSEEECGLFATQCAACRKYRETRREGV